MADFPSYGCESPPYTVNFEEIGTRQAQFDLGAELGTG
ncbi:hypothetical protein REIFOR_02766 [Reinekea forsetii]|uniref:Uncharacterized protein n=1 Tax=Reinekea forsetii TaxID=1336806 RepID=A0A2K8KT39_9GAMM|nr:hypothetical protein REIFOR_02766 [Reinekea forsetii]